MSDAPTGAAPPPPAHDQQAAPHASEVANAILNSLQWALDGASALRGTATSPPDTVPPRYRDGPPLQEQTHRPIDVLGHLAELWIITREPGAWARPVTAVFERLTKARAARGFVPVRIGPVVETSLTESLWKAACYVTQTMGGAFGCGQLVSITRTAFPDDPARHPSLIHGALTWFAALPFDPPEMVQAVIRLGREPSVMTRLTSRFAGYEVRNALGAVQFAPLYDWLRETFPAFDGPWLRQELALEFTLLPNEAPVPNTAAPTEDDNYITAVEAATFTGMRLPTLSKLCKPGGPVRYYRPAHNSLRVHAADLSRYIQSRERAAADKKNRQR
jgi:hypothetical protein